MDTDFGDTLNSLAQFGASIGGTIAQTYRTVNAPVFPIANTTIPTAAPQVSPFAKQSNTIIEIVVIALVGLGVLLGFRALSKK